MRAALVGNYQPEHVFALAQALALYDFYQARVDECDVEIERSLVVLNADKLPPARAAAQGAPPDQAAQRSELRCSRRPVSADGRDLTQIHGIGPYLALRLIAECGTDLSKWRTAKHFTSWLTLSPGCKISGGKVLSAHTRKTTQSRERRTFDWRPSPSAERTLRSAPSIARLAARIGKAKAVTATARKIAVLFYNAMRFGMDYQDPGAEHYERKYRERVIKNLHRRAAEFGFTLQEAARVFLRKAAAYFAKEVM